MKRVKPHSHRGKSSKGIALVISLGFIVILTGLVTAYLVSMRLDRLGTNNYSHQVQVQELAKGAAVEIIEDLRTEIEAGSLQGPNYSIGDVEVYVPTSSLTMVPARYGFTPDQYALDIDPVKVPPSLVRVSRGDVDLNTVFPDEFYPGNTLPADRASTVSTKDKSLNGRCISPGQWSKPMLMGETVPSAFEETPPDWIYVTRDGSGKFDDGDLDQLKNNAALDETGQVLGRYAYAIYDMGGLLDVNVAGFPSTLENETGGPEEIRSKSVPLFAALSALPGLDEDKIDDFITWRSKGTVADAGSFAEAVDMWKRDGFLQANEGDSPLLSRQDLIAYFADKAGTTDPLPYMSTHSRQLAAPSARPLTPDGSSIDYDADADLATSANRDLANVRFLDNAVITHYADDGSSSTYTVKEGDPLLQSRFSLARLAWLEEADPEDGSGPSPEKADAIKAAFGLVWDYPGGSSGTTANGGNKCWNYVGADGSLSDIPTEIMTLEKVAEERREPNFFELLKAGILSGSLGLGPGEAAFNNGLNVEGFNKDYYYPWGDDAYKHGTAGFYSHTFGPSSEVPAPARIPDMQIIRIGANIIDQYDRDSYPTAIYFKYNGVDQKDPAGGTESNPIHGPVTMAYGTENLPYLQSIRLVLASPDRSSSGTPGPGTDLSTNVFGGWRQPYLWNPHQQPASDLVNRPGSYEIRAYGSSVTYWSWPGHAMSSAGKDYNTGYSNVVDYYTLPGLETAEDINRGTITFDVASPNTASSFFFYDLAYPLTQDTLPGVTATSPFEGNRGTSSIAYYDESIPAPFNLANHFVGFSTGVTPTDPLSPAPYRPFYVSDSNGLTGQGRPEVGANTYVLGWTDSSGGFHPYSFMTGVFTFDSMKLEQPHQRVGSANPQKGTETWMQPDPRTGRFSIAKSLQGNNIMGTLGIFWKNGSAWFPSARPAGEQFEGQGYPWQAYSFAWGDLQVNAADDPNQAIYNSGSREPNYYRDPDGVVRPADGFYGQPGTGDGMMSFINNGAPAGDAGAGDNTATRHARRPVILNRPFNSVGELGYVFRDMPFKTLDFFSGKSADTALLDLFSLRDNAVVASNKLRPLVSGRVNPNAVSVPVLTALLQGGAKKETDTDYNLEPGQAENIAQAVVDKLMVESGGYQPFNGYQDLVPALVEAMRDSIDPADSSADRGNKAYLEAPIRALAESSDFRTWNLMIDLVAQSGGIPESAQELGDFVVQSQCRYWVHVSIDRYTGEVIARQLEPVYE